MQFIFRDDDTSFFTEPALLERVYARLWDRAIPVALAVIPNHHGKIVIRDRLDHNVPPSHRGQDACFPIADNPALCAWLQAQAQAGLVEICQHGTTHDFMECVTEDGPAFRQQIAEGKRLLQAAFPDLAIQTYLPPYGCVSAEGLAGILDAGMTMTVNPRNWPPVPALADLPPYRCLPNPRGTARYITRGSFDGTPLDDPQGWIDSARATAGDDAVLVHVNHYWQFYQDFGPPDADAFARWDRFLDVILDQPGITFTTFAGCELTPQA